MWHGCTHIAGRYPVRTSEADFLPYGAGLVKGLGFRTIKLELSIAYNSIKYPGQAWSGTPATLTQLAQQAAFAGVFGDSGFDRIWLSVFSLAQPANNPWAGAWTAALGDAIETEFYDLCAHLLATYSGKDFVLSNWEGDWQLLDGFNPIAGVSRSTRLHAYRDYCRRRQRALARARADVSSTSTIRYSVEMNRVLDGWSPRVHRDVLNAGTFDVGGLSTYEAIDGWQRGLSQSALEAEIAVKLARVVARVRRHHSGPIVMSEFGWPIYNPGFVTGGYDVAGLLAAAIGAAESLGIEGAIYWQILDNEEQAPGVPYGFGLYDRNGNSNTVGPLNAAGAFYASLL